jgi:dihydrofolate reductase
MKVFAASTTLDPAQHRDVTLVSSDLGKTVSASKRTSGKDIWLFGGATTFRSLLDEGLVDRVEVSIIPVLLGGAFPWFQKDDAGRCDSRTRVHFPAESFRSAISSRQRRSFEANARGGSFRLRPVRTVRQF